MNRREFLRFTRAKEETTAELSCERLYMRMVDTRRVNAPADFDPRDGEPPTVFDSPTIEDLFADLDRDLRTVRVVRVIDANWIESSIDMKHRLDTVLDNFRARGGRVEFTGYGPQPPSSSQTHDA